MRNLNLPPNAFIRASFTFFLTISLIPGVYHSTFMAGVLIFGNTALRTIFSITSGTVRIMNGCTSVRLLSSVVGDGALVRKNMCAPSQI